MYQRIPTWEKGQWSYTEFETREDLYSFVRPLFKEPGKYEWDETSFAFNEQARLYTSNKFYCAHPFNTRDYIRYWDDQKDKCRNGVIFKGPSNIWYLPRDYYMWINFLPIYDKVKRKHDFPQVWDTQYHRALYELLAELSYHHVAELKKRQIASSYQRCAKLINQLWFEEGPVMKMGASHKDYVNEKGTWKFLNEYRSFLNEHTAWYRPMTPGKTGMWQQQIEITKGNRKTMKGHKGTIQMLTFDKDPTTGVGGGIRYFFYEEAGIAPTMDITAEYLFPAMQAGDITTGMFIAAGSVGDLDQCEPLRKMILKPKGDSIYPVISNLLDSKGTIGETGLFIPEQWSMPPYIDQYGNSQVEQALEAIKTKRKLWKETLSPEKYQIRISQSPTNIEEAFAIRKASLYPVHLVTAQIARIEDKTYPVEYVDLSRDSSGKVIYTPSARIPIMEFPIDPAMEDKRACVCMYKRPPKDPQWGLFYASVDPVGEGRTTTSESLCSIYIYKRAVEVQKIENGEPKNFIEHDEIVASWCGRYDSIDDTHELLEMLIELYNAWTIVENNISGFIVHMKHRKKTRYLATKDQMLFLKEAQANQNVFQEFGWRNTGGVFSKHMLDYGIEYTKEVLDTVTTNDGTIVKTIYGIERIPDIMLLKEMLQYQVDINADRIVAYSALVAFAKLQEANRGLPKRIDDDGKGLKNPKDLFKLNSRTPFTHMGGNKGRSSGRSSRNPFHNLK